jgi:hypothetical protein
VSATAATLEADVNPQGLATHYHFEYGLEPCASSACTPVPVPDAELPGGSSPVRVKVGVEGLSPASVYHFRIVANNGAATTSPDRIFATYSASLLEGLPENRGYEQASPINKDAGDAVGSLASVKAASDGSGISFGSTFAMPGAVGAQALPSFLAKRSGEPGSWATQGLLPPELLGERAQVLGWLPDYSKTYSNVTKLGNPRTTALVQQSTDGKAPVLMTPYVIDPEYSYAGATEDGSVVFFEARVKLPPKEGQPAIPGALEGASNLYAWDQATGEAHLAGVLNDQQVPGKGAFAGPYAWGEGTNAAALSHGGGARGYYLQDGRAISDNGDVYFTAAGTGQLYLRKNPTRPQSTMEGEKCLKEEDACTIHVSASKRTTPDTAGPQPAAFQAASADGSKAFFTSLEELTEDANTGPEQPEAQVSLGDIKTGEIEKEDFLAKTKAVGLAVDGEHIYWADPSTGAIGRANLDGTGIDKTFIAPPPGECEVEVEFGVSKKVSIPSIPRYVAVDGEYIYWTNTGLLEEGPESFPIGGGTIGRAKLNGEKASIEPAFICGASNPQGIAVNATHIYWANAASPLRPGRRYVSRAKIDGSNIEYGFIDPPSTWTPFGVALDGEHVYYSVNDEPNNEGYIYKAPLEGGASDGLLFIGEAGVRGVSVDAGHIYWASQSEEAIGRAAIDFESREKEFIKVVGKPTGVAADASHLYWSINGEAPANPGNDLYLYQPEGNTLEDLTPEPGSENGAEVQGVVGASADGSRVYFVANGDLDGAGAATAGDCRTTVPHGEVISTSGQCSLYLRAGSTTSFVARLRASTDAANWLPSPREPGGAGTSYTSRTSFLSPDGKTLLFRSTEQLSTYQNEGTPELYRYREGDPEGIRCVSCPPNGQLAGAGASTGSIVYPGLRPRTDIAAFSSRPLSAEGDRVFFETAEALSPLDTNGEPPQGCPASGSGNQKFPACLDVYEWVAPGPETGCKEDGPNYSPLDAGCVYLISTGKDKFPSLFADASASGNDVFFFTRQQLVGQDKDELQDVYDARVGGGLASQGPATVIPCESVEGCHGPLQVPPAEPALGGSATFVGPANPAPKRTKPKKTQKKHKAKKHKQKGKAKKQRANNKGRASR